MAYRYVEYSNEGLFCGTSINSTIRDHFTMEKNDEKLLINEDQLLKLYNNGPIKIKISKYKDVTELAREYVPQEYQWFYSSLKAKENNRDCETDYEN